jgi:uncharacterized phiE125 gp8 family phage protein
MGVSIITQPTVEPVSLEEAKLYLRVDATSEDDLVSSLIQAAREYVETHTRRTLVYTTYRYTLDTFPGWYGLNFTSQPIELPKYPVAQTSAAGAYSYAMPRVRYYDEDGVQQTLTYADDDFDLSLSDSPAKLQLYPGDYWPSTEIGRASAVEVDFVAGYGPTAASVPESLKTVIKLLIGHWFENRQAVAPGFGAEVPLAVDSILRIHSLGSYS